jgi:integrase
VSAARGPSPPLSCHGAHQQSNTAMIKSGPMTGTPYLMTRHGTLYWRRRVNKNMAQVLNRRHVAISLKTRDIEIAKLAAQKISVLWARYSNAVQTGRTGLSPGDLKATLSALRESVLSDRPQMVLQARPDASERRESVQVLMTRIEGIRLHFTKECTIILAALNRLVTDETLPTLFRGELPAQALPDARQACVADTRSSWPAPPPTGKPLSSYIDAYISETKKARREGTRYQARLALTLFLRILGDRPVGSIARADTRRIHDVLERLPCSHGRSVHDHKRSIETIIRSRGTAAPTIGRATLDRHWAGVRQFFAWLNVQDDVPEINLTRIFDGFQWGEHVPGEQPRILWDDRSIECLFASPIWSGFKPHPRKRYWRHQVGAVVVKDEYWWLPLLGIYQGAREEELCRLRGTDIFQTGGITVMSFHGSHLKNRASTRLVPIHSALLRLGLVELATAAGDGLLFPGLREEGRDRKLSYRYSKEFTSYRKRIGLYRRGMDFHSFRHTVTTKLIAEGRCSILEADEITGHDSKHRKEIRENQSESLRYFKGHKIRILKEAIETIAYTQIDIERLTAIPSNAAIPKQWVRVFRGREARAVRFP